MEYGVQTAYPYSLNLPPGYFAVYPQHTQATYDVSNWTATLISLRGQRSYLEGLLSTTAMTLNTLRDKQTRNERALSAGPTPRTKKKKIQQNRWRTDKTIKTCENEKRVILDCLTVCQSNIDTLEAILCPTETISAAAEYYTYTPTSFDDTDTISTDIDWNGWTDESPVSPFQRKPHSVVMSEEIPPDHLVDGDASLAGKKPPPLPLRAHVAPSAEPLLVPPNTAKSYTALSPEVTGFEPNITHCRSPEIDKLSISGLLASKRVQRIQRQSERRFSDMAICRHLDGNEMVWPSLAAMREYHSESEGVSEPSKRTRSF
jgi:hypothetical protein